MIFKFFILFSIQFSFYLKRVNVVVFVKLTSIPLKE